MKFLRIFALIAVATAAMSAGPAVAQQKKLAITAISEVLQVLDLKRGLVEELGRLGYVEGKNLKVDFVSALGNFQTQQQIARKFADDGYDVIVPITTSTAIAVTKAAEETKTPVVFSMVIDPLRAKIVSSLANPGGMVTGVSDMPAIDKDLEMMMTMVPTLKAVGIVLNPSLASSQTTLELLKEAAAKKGITIVDAPAPNSGDVLGAARSLVGKVDVLYSPNDTTVNAALESIVKIGIDNRVPVFAGALAGVKRGAIAAIGFDYYDVGVRTAGLVKQVFEGKKPGDMGVIVMKDVQKKMVMDLNLKSAEAMGLTIPAAVQAEAHEIYK
jgi:putative ABC transport system substrate-binding protein